MSPRVAPRLPVSSSSPPKPHARRQTTSGVDPPVPCGGSSWPEAPRRPGLAPPCHLSFAASLGPRGIPGAWEKTYLFKGVGVEEVCSCFLVGFSFWFFFLFSYFPLKKVGAKRDAGAPELGLPLVPLGSERGTGRVWRAGSRCSLLRGQGSVCVTRTSFKATPPPPGALRGVVCCPRGKAAAFRGSAFFPPFSVDLRSWTALFFCDVL